MSTPYVRYLSKEWREAEWTAFEEQYIGDDTSDCGGWTWDPPCGGCARCMRMQFGHGLQMQEDDARVFLKAGFDVADPRLVQVEITMDYHDGWRCNRAGEREDFFYPWEKRNG